MHEYLLNYILTQLQSASHPLVAMLRRITFTVITVFQLFLSVTSEDSISCSVCSDVQVTSAKIQCNHVGRLYLCHVPIVQQPEPPALGAVSVADGLVCVTGYEMEICVPVLYHLRDKA